MTEMPTMPSALSAQAAKPVQTPLALIMTLKSEQAYQDLNPILQQFAAMPDSQNPIVQAMDGLGTVHFARFIFLENNTKLAVITTFDGDMDIYLQDFAAQVGQIFDLLFAHMVGGPPAPVKDYPQEFMAYVKANNAAPVGFYSAYPTKTVLDIRNAD